MSRASVTVREAVPEDAADLVVLWSEAVQGKAGPETDAADEVPLVPPEVMEAATALARIAADPDERLLVACAEGRTVAAVHLRRGPLSPLQTGEVVHVSHLMVLPDLRRKGVATALLAAATSWAEEKDSGQLVAVTPARSRETNRFLARLGFSGVGVIRVAQVSALSSRFASRACGSRDTGRLIAVRRTLRRRFPDGAGPSVRS